MQAHSSSVNCMSFSNNDSIIATGSSDGSVAIYKVMTKQPSGSLTEATGKVGHLMRRTDDRRLGRFVIGDVHELRALFC